MQDQSPTDDEQRALADYIDRLNHGLCPKCGDLPERYEQVYGSVYARPCNHRMMKGNAVEYAKGVGRPEAASRMTR